MVLLFIYFFGKGNVSVKMRVWRLCILFLFLFYFFAYLARKLSIGSVSDLLVGLSEDWLLYMVYMALSCY